MGRGQLRIYLGAAPGVGKTFAMLAEGRRRRERGADVVVAYVETHGRPKTIEQLDDLETVPRRSVTYRDATLEEMDVDAVLRRMPELALVDELAHTNAPGSRNPKRWMDVDELLDAGIDVITTVNVQHLESLNDVVERIAGVKQRETVPDAVVRAADQVELVDMTPEALRRRMAHGNIYTPDKVDAALANYFRIGNLGALRELALLWVADKVDDALQAYMDAHDIDHVWETRERVVVAITGAPSGDQLIRRAARLAQRHRADLLGVHITTTDGLAEQSNALLDAHRQLLADLGGTYHETVGSDVPAALVQFAQSEHATQLVLGATHRTRWHELTSGSVINEVIRSAGEIDVHVISTKAEPVGDRHGPRRRRRRTSQLSNRRQSAGWAAALVGIPALTVVLRAVDESLNLTSASLLYVVLVAAVALVGGRWPSIAAGAASALVLNWYFTEPVNTFSITEPDNLLALAIFITVAILVSGVVSRASRSAVAAERARAEAQALARVAGGLAGDDDALVEMVTHLRTTFDLDGVSLLVPDGAGGWTLEASAGADPPRSPIDGHTVDIVEGGLLAFAGPPLGADDLRVVQVFAAQVGVALERRRLRDESSVAVVLAETDRLRTAILRAVSHDLRTPLASIKASVTSLLEPDMDWPDAARTQFLETIDDEADRLNRLVGNLLDMSRLESGALAVTPRPVALEELVAHAVARISGPTERVEIAVPETVAAVAADADLLERAVANLTSNALAFAPPDTRVRIEAGEVGDRVDLRIVDYGRGVAEDERNRVFEPFQRLGDGASSATSTGVGLGLAVARGFVEAMHGKLVLEDTPGGGLTAVIELPKART
jgi:two-component system sensor histidine kinase KdpD